MTIGDDDVIFVFFVGFDSFRSSPSDGILFPLIFMSAFRKKGACLLSSLFWGGRMVINRRGYQSSSSSLLHADSSMGVGDGRDFLIAGGSSGDGGVMG